MTNFKATTLAAISLLLLMTGFSGETLSRPENIKPGLSYFADEFTVNESVAELGEEKNYEEVFKNYEYYEMIYDEQKRPAVFRAYKRGEVVSTEYYFYGNDGKLFKKELKEPGKPAKIIHFR